MKKENITIYDIAKKAKVSPSTVSRVLTGNARVRPETTKKIKEIIDKNNFKPNGLARSLLYKKTKMIGFVIPDINHSFFSTLVLKSEAHALKMGYTSFLCNSMNNSEMESNYLQTLLEKQVDGIIFLGGRINEIETDPVYAEEMKRLMERIPVVFINGKMTGVDAHVVRTDEAYGIWKLVELIANHGHTKIGFLGGLKGISSTENKKNSFKLALNHQSIPVSEEWILGSDFSIESGEEAAAQLLNLKDKPTAVVCVNDFVAMGAINMFTKFGLRVPDDISVLGFDDIYLAKYYPPGITTVTQNYDMLGQTAVNVLVELIEGKEAPKETIIPTSLVLRNSCKVYRGK
ncbi:LacI family transcriptional regulator [Salipaludibacillus neizhouensis]|uniref:LacI family transcriptional regulator n=1 Tax=Salipaludibacillus neizhouensis TaxID=885475 RepID=A0A3A9K8U5_9BACI|nr:LacI family DNA-binding transcriptional regulator [Salipaludibacillus neizhouensis]RKL66942.1 LacI family transcriptional regulator [Salipaludibacillus neizhouensis]